jgi:putative DNA primase/helicase
VTNDSMTELAGILARQVASHSAPWQRPQAPGYPFMPINPVSGVRYKAINAIDLSARAIEAGYTDNRWLTGKQAEALGATMRPRQAGQVIRHWTFQEKQDGKIVRLDKPKVTLAVVYNAEQFNGLPERPEPVVASIEARTLAVGNAFRNMHAGVAQDANGGGARFDLERDIILLKQRDAADNPAQQHMEAIHQLAHWTGHPSRLGFGGHPPGSIEFAREELRANIASLMMADDLRIGFDPGQHTGFAESWRELILNDPTEIFRAAMVAEKIAHEIVEMSRERRAVELSQEQMQALAIEAIQIEGNHPAMSDSIARTYLAVPYADRDQAKALGAKWDKEAKAWFVPANTSLSEFEKWRPESGNIVIATEQAPTEQFADALKQRGLVVEGVPVMNGMMQRVPVIGDKAGERSGAYKGYLDGIPAGYIENFKDGAGGQTWKATGRVAQLTRAERESLLAQAAQHRAEQEQARLAAHAKTAAQVEEVWKGAKRAVLSEHPYLDRKGVSSYGLSSAFRNSGGET